MKTERKNDLLECIKMIKKLPTRAAMYKEILKDKVIAEFAREKKITRSSVYAILNNKKDSKLIIDYKKTIINYLNKVSKKS